MILRSVVRKTGSAIVVGLCITALTACSMAGAAQNNNSSKVTASEGKEAAKAFLKENTGGVSFIAPGGAIDVSKAKGRAIAVVTNDASVPFAQAVIAGMSEASKEAGVTLQVYDAKGSTDTAAKQINQAVASKAAAIVDFGVNFNLIPSAIEAANAAGVPVVGALAVDANAPLQKGSAGEVSIDYKKSGKLVVAHAVATTDGPVHAAYQNLPSIETFSAMKQGVEQGFSEFCSTECSLQNDDLTQSNFKTGAETLTGTEVSRIKGLNWIIPAFDGIAQFTIPAVELAGKKDNVKVGSINASKANLQYVLDGRVQAVDVGNNNNWLGWAMVDRALRAFAGEKPSMSVVPVKLFDVNNLQNVDLNSEDALYDNVPYRASYSKLWNR